MKTCGACGQRAEGEASWCAACGAALPGTSSAPTVLVDGRYRVESTLGHGFQGAVFLAQDIGLGRRVALKLINPEFSHEPVFVERFKREAMALASVRSEHVVQVYAFGRYQSSYYFAMEYLKGQSLQAVMDEHDQHGRSLSVHRALTIVRQVASGLSAIHAAGIIHRDVKPENVLIEEDTGRPVLVDLGLAHQRDPESDRRISTAGTPAYMAPEQIVGAASARIAAHTDIYALGCTAFHLLTGTLPFEGDTPMAVMCARLHHRAPRLSDRKPALAPLDAVIARCLSISPEARFESCEAFMAALDEAALPWLLPQPSPHRAAARSSLRLLVVDDDEVFSEFAAEACRVALPLCELELVVCQSGVEALRAASKSLPDIVVLDRDMPLLDGCETLSYLREIEGGHRVEVFVASADLGKARGRFEALGVKQFLIKPVSFRDMAAAIGEAARRAVARRQRPCEA